MTTRQVFTAVIVLGVWVTVSCLCPAGAKDGAESKATVPPAAADAAASGFEKMITDQFSFEIPANTDKLSKGNGRLEDYVQGQMVYGGKSRQNWFFIYQRELAPGENLNEIYQKAYEDFKQKMPSYQPLADEEVRLSGQPALKHTYKYPWGEPWYQQYDVWAQDGNTAVIAACYHYPNLKDPAPAEQACGHFFDTFQFR